MKVVTLQGDMSKTASEAIQEASELEWQDVLCIGYGSKGELQVISSHVSNADANLILDMVKLKLLQPMFDGEVL